MSLRKRPLATGVAALVFSSWVSALGLGEIQLHSALNEPLDAEIRLHNLGELTETEIIAGLASASEFTRAGLEREAILSELTFSLDLANPAAPLLRVSSQRAIREPYLDFLVDVTWPSGRLLREYTLLLDLPVYAADQPLRSSPEASSRSLQWQEQRAAPPPPAPRQQAPLVRDLPPVAPGDEYTVNDGDTLWRLASRLSGSESVHSKMAAIHQLNPAAFINGDINLLRRGAVLRLPDYGQLADAPAAPASSPASAPNDPEDNAVAPARFSETADTGSRAEPGEVPVGRLRLSAIDPNTVNDSELLTAASGEGAGAGSELIRSELQGIQDELARSQRENDELKSRLANLEDQLATMQRMMEVGSDSMRAAQLTAGSEAVFEDDAQASLPGPDADATPEESATAASSSPRPAAPVPAQSQTNKGWFETVSSYLIYIVGALAVLIVALVVAVLRKRRQDRDDDNTVFMPPPVVNRQRVEPVQPASAPVAKEPPPQSSVSSLDEIDLSEEDDLFARPAGRETDAWDDSVDEFEELVEPSVTPAPVARQQPSADEIDDIELDLSEFELDDFQGDQPEPAAAKTQAGLDDALNLDDFDFLGDADEGETQLGLAQAYLDMGDHASAREILQEVLDAGSEDHKDRARALLDGLS